MLGSLIRQGVPMRRCSYRDTSDARFAVHSHVNTEQVKVKVMVSREKVARMRADHLGRA